MEEVEQPTLWDSQERLVIRYNPQDTVYANWYTDLHTRKNRVSFYVYRSDPFVLNYDLLDLETIEYYLRARYERARYLDMLPVLRELRRQRMEELEWEEAFVHLVTGQLDCSADLVWSAIEWWKKKTKWHRPITEDDAKALRMIRRRIQRTTGD